MVWPVYLWAPMYQDRGQPLAVGDSLEWDVVMVDGDAEGWPAATLVDTTMRIESRPSWAMRGSLAVTPELSACWRGDEPLGSVRPIMAGLEADFFNPAFRTTIVGTIDRIQVVSRCSAQDATGTWRPTGPWRLREVREAPKAFAHAPVDTPASEQEDGLLVDVDVVACELR